jgi:hypothetical protein
MGEAERSNGKGEIQGCNVSTEKCVGLQTGQNHVSPDESTINQIQNLWMYSV